MHLCQEHQGNHSHYAKENCVICKQADRIERQAAAIRQLREALKGAISDVGHEMSDGYMESVMHSTDYHDAKAALAATEDVCANS
jgi:hypothetical protein